MEVQTQPEPGLWHHWNIDPSAGMATVGPAYGLSRVDPTPIATHMVSADALEGES